MFPGSISLALCTVVFRRCFDALTGRIPAPLPVSNVSNISTMFMISGALIYLYSHLRRGTLVRIGQGHRNYSGSKNISLRGSRHNKSWFLKNLWGKRKCCTDAIFKIAKHFSDSVTNLNPCLLLPKETFQVSFPNERDRFSRRELSPDTSLRDSNSCKVIFTKETDINKRRQKQRKSISEIKETLLYAGGDRIDGDKRKDLRKSSVRRLESNKGGLDTSVKQSKQSIKFRSEHRRTRSGRVYNPFT